MTVNSKILCSCARRTESLDIEPTKARGRVRNPELVLNKFLAAHQEQPPDDWYDGYNYPSFPFLLDQYRPYHFRDVHKYNASSSPGLFFRRRGYRTQGDVYDDPKAVQLMRNTVHHLKMGDRVGFSAYVCVVDSKLDLLTNVEKLRVAWVYDLTLLHIEKMFALPIIDQIDFETYVPTAARYHDEWCSRDSLGFDVSSFDASVPAWLIKEAFQIIFSRFDLTTYEGGNPVYSHHSLERLVKVIVSNFIYTRYSGPNNISGRKRHGVPSGSAFTNIVDSIVSKLVAVYVHRRSGCMASVNTYGDDTFVRGCTCGFADMLEGYRSLGFKVKIELPNVHGCLKYCKEECHGGFGFHPGLWFVNILNCLKDERYRGLVIYGLILCYNPTPLQRDQLLYRLSLEEPPRPGDLTRAPPWVKNLLTKGAPQLLDE